MLEQLSRGLAGVRGRRKALVYIGEGIDYDVFGLSQRLGTSAEDEFIHRSYGGNELGDAAAILESDLRAVRQATRANVTIYAIDPRGLGQSGEGTLSVGLAPGTAASDMGITSIESGMRTEYYLGQQSLVGLAKDMGGFALLNQNDFAAGLSRLVEANSRYYRFGFEEKDGKLHDEVELSVVAIDEVGEVRGSLRREFVTTLKATDDQAVFTRTERRGGDEVDRPGSGLVSRVETPLAGLAPGDYLVEVTARSLAGRQEASQRVRIEVF